MAKGSPGRLASAAPEAWISLVIAVILLLLYPNFLHYLVHPHDTASLDAFDGATGATISYVSSAFYWTDSAVAAFCLVLLVDAAVLIFAPKRTLLTVAAMLSFAVALYNLWVIVHTMHLAGLPIQCALAAGFGLYLGAVQLNVARRT